MALVHEALLYRDTAQYVRGVVPFVRAGLAEGEPVLVAVPPANLDVLRGELTTGAGDLRFADITEAGRNPGRIIPWVLHRFVAEHEGQPVRVVGEPVWPGRAPVRYPAAVQHEAMVNAVFREAALTLLCPYDAARLDPRTVSDADSTHPVVVECGERRPSLGYTDPAVIVDAYNEPMPSPSWPVATLPFDLRDLALVRRFVADHAARVGMPEERTADLQIAINELTTNSIAHGGGRGELRLWCEGEDALVCEVSDRGHITDPTAGRIRPTATTLNGRGLIIVHDICDLVRIFTRPGQTVVRVYMRLTEATPRQLI